MFSIRECTFETNSSSCHCFVVCNTKLMDQLKKYELLYIGPFSYSDVDDEIYENEVNPNTVINKDQLISILEDFVKKPTVGMNPYTQKQQQWLMTHEWNHMTIEHIVNHTEFNLFEVLDYLGFHYVHPETIFGGRKRHTSILSVDEFLDPNTKESVTTLLTHIGC